MKSFILSLSIVSGIFVFFMSVFDKKANAFYNRIPEWIFIALIIICFAALLLSLYWGITGLAKGQRLLNVFGIFTSIFGIAIFAMFYWMDRQKGQEMPGQFDHELSLVESSQRSALTTLMNETNTDPKDVQLVAYWKMNHHPGKFVVCIQKGNVIALQIKDKPVSDMKNISALQKLNWLILTNCKLQNLSGLDLPALQRLYVNNNQLKNLDGIVHSPGLQWLEYSGNPMEDSSAAKRITDKNLYAN